MDSLTRSDQCPPDWDEYARRSGTTGFPSGILSKYAGAAVLDVGGGVGAHLAQMPVGRLRVNCEISLERLCQGKTRYPELAFVQGNGCRLPFGDDTFDTVISIDVIEHLFLPSTHVAEIRRVLRPGGHLILQTPNYPAKRAYDLVNYCRRTWRKTLLDDPTHVSRFTWLRLEKLIREYLIIVDSVTRNVFLESRITHLHTHKNGRIAKTFGQKTIIVAKKDSAIFHKGTL
jgi:SAM-dependent methyltransferase